MTVVLRTLAAMVVLTAAFAARATAAPLPLAAYWPLGEGNGQVVHDISGHGNNGMLGSSAAAETSDPSWIHGGVLGALHFNDQQSVSIPDSASLRLQRLTVLALVRGSASPRSVALRCRQGSPAARPAPTASTPASAAGWRSTSTTASTTASRPRRREASGTAAGTRSPDPTTASGPASSSTAGRSAPARRFLRPGVLHTDHPSARPKSADTQAAASASQATSTKRASGAAHCGSRRSRRWRRYCSTSQRDHPGRAAALRRSRWSRGTSWLPRASEDAPGRGARRVPPGDGRPDASGPSAVRFACTSVRGDGIEDEGFEEGWPTQSV